MQMIAAFFFLLKTVPGCMDSISPAQSAFHIKFTVDNWWTTAQLDFKVTIMPSGPQIYECSYIVRSVKSLPSYKAVHSSRKSSEDTLVARFTI